MSNTILFVFEGEKTEVEITNSFSQYFVNQNTNVTCAFCADIYQLYSKLWQDTDLDTFSVLKNRQQNAVKLAPYKRSDFAEIYLFFDYDGHATNASDSAIKDLVAFFDEETELGKIFISYPMVEALIHLSSTIDFENLKVKCKTNIQYKKIAKRSAATHLKNLANLSKNQWHDLIDAHTKKMNSIVNDSFSKPSELISQLEIFDKQLQKFINIDATVSVLSGFPILF